MRGDRVSTVVRMVFIPFWLATLLLAAAVALPDVASAASVTVFPMGASREVGPRETVTLVVHVENALDGVAELTPVLSLPPGWNIVLPPEKLRLEPGQSTVQTAVIVVPADAPAGDYTVTWHYGDPAVLGSPQARFNIRVRPVGRLGVTLISAPRYTIGEPYTVLVQVQNTGNVPDEFIFEADESTDAGTTIRPQRAKLEPGESVTVEVQVQVPRDITEAQTQSVYVLVRSATDPDLAADVTAEVELIPSALSERLAYHFFPLTVRLAGTVRPDEDFQFHWELWGAGTLRDDSSTLWTLLFSRDSSYIAASGDDWRVAAGNQWFYLSSLTESGQGGVGLDTSLRAGRWSAQVVHYQPYEEDGNQWWSGARVGYLLSPGADVSLQYLWRAPSPQPLWSVSSGGLLGTRWEYGIEFGQDAAASPGPAAAHSARVSYLGSQSSWMLGYEEQESGFRGRPHPAVVQRVGFGTVLGPVQLFAHYEDHAGTGRASDSTAQYTQLNLWGGTQSTIWSAGMTHARENDPATGSGERRQPEAHLNLFHSLRNGHMFDHGLTWEREERVVSPGFAQVQDEELAYTARYRWPTSYGSFAPFVRLRSPLVSGELGSPTIGAGVQVNFQLGSRFNGYIVMQKNDVQSSSYRLALGSRYTFAGDKVLELSATQWRTPRDETLYRVTAGLRIPLSVPLGRRSNTGAVQGRIVDEEGQPVSGVIVRLSNWAVTTDADGVYRFPAVPEGTAYLVVAPEQVGINYISAPATPLPVEVVRGETAGHDFQLMPAASVRVDVRVPADAANHQATAANGILLGSALQTAPPAIDGMVVELRGNGTVMRQTVLSDNPSVTFRYLYPGEWYLTVYRMGLSELYAIQPQQAILSLEAGEHQDVVVNIAPLPRLVRFLDGGDVQVATP